METTETFGELLEAARRALADIGRVVALLEQQTVAEVVEQAPLADNRWLQALLDLEPDKPTGAWGMTARTARYAVNMAGGRAASEQAVRINRARVVTGRPGDYWERIAQAAGEYEIPVAVVMALCCRESNQGAALNSRGEGDGGNGFGVMQVDKRYHTQRGRPDPYSLEHLRQGCEIFAGYRGDVARIHPMWEDKYVLKGACVAYNSGLDNVVTIERMDRKTTGNDYGADVMARAQYYQQIVVAGKGD